MTWRTRQRHTIEGVFTIGDDPVRHRPGHSRRTIRPTSSAHFIPCGTTLPQSRVSRWLLAAARDDGRGVPFISRRPGAARPGSVTPSSPPLQHWPVRSAPGGPRNGRSAAGTSTSRSRSIALQPDSSPRITSSTSWLLPTCTWTWKDEDELDLAVERGRLTPCQGGCHSHRGRTGGRPGRAGGLPVRWLTDRLAARYPRGRSRRLAGVECDSGGHMTNEEHQWQPGDIVVLRYRPEQAWRCDRTRCGWSTTGMITSRCTSLSARRSRARRPAKGNA